MREKIRIPASEYRAMKLKLGIWSLLLLGVVVLFFAVIQAIHNGHFSTAITGLLQSLLQTDPNNAWVVYTRYIRDGSGIVLYVIFGALFVLILYRLLSQFVRYFAAVNQGMDSLLSEQSEDVSLPPELIATEKKINAIKHTLEKRKTDAMLAEQRKNDLVVYLAHDLKTPLTSVIGYLSLLRDEPQISEELQRRYLGISLEKAEHLEDLINEFFEITRFNLSNIQLQLAQINLTRMLEQLVFEFQPMLAERELQCELDCPPDLMIKCDPGKLQRVLDNLLRNAVSYCYAGSRIGIKVEAEADEKKRIGDAVGEKNWSGTTRAAVPEREHARMESPAAQTTDGIPGTVTLRFTNHGATIPQEKLARIFEQFYRLDSSRSSSSGGAGLGLAIAKQIIEKHHGSITVSSQNEVTEFTIVLPTDPEHVLK